MCLNDISAVNLPSAHTTVVWPLRSRESTLGPTIRPIKVIQKSILLLETEPDIVLCIGLHQPIGLMAVVVLVGASIGIPGLAQDKDVFAETEGVGIDGDGANVDVGVVTGSLTSGGAVEVPFR